MKKRRKGRGIEKEETEQAVVRQRKNKRESKSYIGRLRGLKDGSKKKKPLNVVGLPSLQKHFPTTPPSPVKVMKPYSTQAFFL